MPAMTFPSPEAPPFPAVRLDVPDGWSVIGVPATVLAVAEPAVDGGAFRRNVTVSVSRMRVGVSVEAAASEVLRAIEGEAAFTLIGRAAGTVSDFKSERLVYQFEVAGTLVRQTQVLVVVPVTNAAQDLVAVIGSAAAGASSPDGDETVASVLGSLEVAASAIPAEA